MGNTKVKAKHMRKSEKKVKEEKKEKESDI